jgi:hypothetical protein
LAWHSCQRVQLGLNDESTEQAAVPYEGDGGLQDGVLGYGRRSGGCGPDRADEEPDGNGGGYEEGCGCHQEV